MRDVVSIVAGFVRTAVFICVTAAVVLWLAASQWGQPLRALMGNPAFAAVSATATPTVVAATATALPSATPTASATPVPTQTATPTATPFVLQRTAVIRALSNKWTMVAQKAYIETTWKLDTSAQRSRFDQWYNGTINIMAHSSYDVSAGFDLSAVQVLVNQGNQVTITLPPAQIVAVDEREQTRSITAQRNGLPYTFRPDNDIDVGTVLQIGIEMAADAQHKACAEQVLERATEHASYKIKEWVLELHPSLRYQDISVITAPGMCR
jgi:hypothetical protein